jgi:MFS family permease
MARILVGVGEAGLNPSALSTISDLFPASKRFLPLNIFYVGGILGAGLASVIGAVLLGAVEPLEGVSLGALGQPSHGSGYSFWSHLPASHSSFFMS